MNRSLPPILVSLVLLLGGCAIAQIGAIEQSYEAMAAGKYDAALRKLADAEKYATPSPEMMAEILFLRASCFEQSNRLPKAIETYRRLVSDFPESSYGYQATEHLKALESKATPPVVTTP